MSKCGAGLIGSNFNSKNRIMLYPEMVLDAEDKMWYTEENGISMERVDNDNQVQRM